jgi:hypothetical protein
LRNFSPTDLLAICAVVGFGCVVFGVAQYSSPAGWIVLGLGLLARAFGPWLRKV